MNEKMSKRRIQITDLQKQEIEEKEEANKLFQEGFQRLQIEMPSLLKIS